MSTNGDDSVEAAADHASTTYSAESVLEGFAGNPKQDPTDAGSRAVSWPTASEPTEVAVAMLHPVSDDEPKTETLGATGVFEHAFSVATTDATRSTRFVLSVGDTPASPVLHVARQLRFGVASAAGVRAKASEDRPTNRCTLKMRGVSGASRLTEWASLGDVAIQGTREEGSSSFRHRERRRFAKAN